MKLSVGSLTSGLEFHVLVATKRAKIDLRRHGRELYFNVKS